jgi:hypothetical protein
MFEAVVLAVAVLAVEFVTTVILFVVEGEDL